MPDKKDFPKLNTQARVDFYKKNNLKMDATTELPKEKAVKTKPTPKTRKKPTANEIKPDATNVPKLDLDKAKKASDNDEVDLYQDARNGMTKTRLKIQQLEYDKERRAKEDKERDKALEGGANASQYDTDKTTKAIKDYQLERKDNQSIAKMMKKVKNSCSSSPAAALTFQPKTNINSGMNSPPKPSATGDAATPVDSSSDDQPWGIWSEENIKKRKNNKKTKKEFRSLVK
jgi:hypothetical protein